MLQTDETECDEQGAQEEQHNNDTSTHNEDGEEENPFLEGFGCFDEEDDNESNAKKSEISVSEDVTEGCSKNNQDPRDNNAVSSDRGISLHCLLKLFIKYSPKLNPPPPLIVN